MKITYLKINNVDCVFEAAEPFIEKDGYQIFSTYAPKYFLKYSGSGEIFVQIQGVIPKDYDAMIIFDEFKKKSRK